MSIQTEQDLIAAVRDGLPGVDVVWGFLEFESAEAPPSFPLVAVSRVNAALLGGTGLQDMCDEDDDTSTILLQIDSWQRGYEDSRNLNEDVHSIVASLEGWKWQSESDIRDPQIKAWRITSLWRSNGER